MRNTLDEKKSFQSSWSIVNGWQVNIKETPTGRCFQVIILSFRIHVEKCVMDYVLCSFLPKNNTTDLFQEHFPGLFEDDGHFPFSCLIYISRASILGMAKMSNS